MALILFFRILCLSCIAADWAWANDEDTPATSKKSERMSVLEVIRFRNEPCVGNSGRNGTCYTSDECSNKGGTSSGSCANSFGVCCVFTVGCGARISENCTYFTSPTAVAAGQCRVRVCKCRPDVCQLRLDFNSFVITGPSTRVASIGLATAGLLTGGGKAVSDATQCQTDVFTITGPAGNTPPPICGTNTGAHIYVPALDACNEIAFQLGQAAINANAVARQWDMKISQLSCNSDNLAPSGCTQYYFGSTTNTVRSFNFDGAPSYHLADQRQKICVRREDGMCRICWTAILNTDVQLSGKTNSVMGFVKGNICCAYGVEGAETKGYDCLMIPHATKAATVGMMAPNSICGRSNGLVSGTGAVAKTVCSRVTPFEIEFNSDRFEFAIANAEGMKSAGFRLAYILSKC